MDSDRRDDSGEMYSPDDKGEYMSLDEAPRFSVQGLSDALVDVGERTVETPVEEYTMMLEVTMADRPGRPHPPTFYLECRNGYACTEEQSGSKGAGTCASRWPRYCLPVPLRQAGPLGFGAGCHTCCPDPCGGGFFRVNLMLCPLCH